MTNEEVFSEVSARAPTEYKLKELIHFSYPYREITIKAVVCRNPDASMTKVYRQLLLTIDAGFQQQSTLFQFLGISPNDEFMVQELNFLIEKKLLEAKSEGNTLTPAGRQFINDATVLTIEEKEDYRFLMDSITMEIVSFKQVFTHREKQEKFLPSRNLHRRKSLEILEDKMERLVECYKQDACHSAYLIAQENPEILRDRDVWASYLLALYVRDELTDIEDSKLEVLQPKSLNKHDGLTSLFNEDLLLYRALV